MKSFLIFIISLLPLGGFSQGLVAKLGDKFPSIPIQNIINSPTASININQHNDKKFYLLNFWGTWCSPCLPEMDVLSKLQKANAGKLQIIALSDETRLQNFKNTLKLSQQRCG